jgi:hypothetical protein
MQEFAYPNISSTPLETLSNLVVVFFELAKVSLFENSTFYSDLMLNSRGIEISLLTTPVTLHGTVRSSKQFFDYDHPTPQVISNSSPNSQVTSNSVGQSPLDSINSIDSLKYKFKELGEIFKFNELGENFEFVDSDGEFEGAGEAECEINNAYPSATKVVKLVTSIMSDLNSINHKGFVSEKDLAQSQNLIKFFENLLYSHGYEPQRLGTNNNTYTL